VCVFFVCGASKRGQSGNAAIKNEKQNENVQKGQIFKLRRKLILFC
jgi:hypothetical protein